MDTNALLLPFRSGIDLAAEIERLLPGSRIAVPTPVLGELEQLEARGVDHARAARALAARFEPAEAEGRGDTGVLQAAQRLSARVVTADRRFADRLRRAGISVLVPRDRDRLHLLRADLPAAAPARAASRGKV